MINGLLFFRNTGITIRELIVLYHHILGTQETEAGLVLVEGREIFVLYNGISLESQAVDALSKRLFTIVTPGWPSPPWKYFCWEAKSGISG